MAAPDALDVADSVPQTFLLQLAPKSTPVSPLFCESFWIVAVKFWLPPVGMLTDGGDTVTMIAPGAAVIVIAAAADLLLSEADVAVSVTVPGVGTVAGAV